MITVVRNVSSTTLYIVAITASHLTVHLVGDGCLLMHNSHLEFHVTQQSTVDSYEFVSVGGWICQVIKHECDGSYCLK